MTTKLQHGSTYRTILSTLFCAVLPTILGCSGPTPDPRIPKERDSGNKQASTCPVNQTEYPLPGRPTACLSNDYANFLACLAEAGLTKASTDRAAAEAVKVKVQADVPAIGVGVGAEANDEEKAASVLVAEYEKGETLEKKEKASGVRSCNEAFRAARGLPPLPTANDNYDTLPPPAAAKKPAGT